MSVLEKALKAGSTLAAGKALQQILQLARNILVARLLGPEDFGVVATFMILMTAFISTTDIGIDKFLLRAPPENLDRVQACLTSFKAARFVLVAILMYVFSDDFAALFGRPDLANVYAVIALLPLFWAGNHFDEFRLQRELRYGMILKMQLGSTVAGTLVAVGCAYYLRDYTAMVWGYFAEALVMMSLSHILAERPWRFAFDRQIGREVLIYGWPLLLNGLLLLVISQGDRFLVGTLEGLTDLAGYVAIGALVAGVRVFVSQISNSFLVPLLSAVRDDRQAFLRRSHVAGGFLTLLAMAASVPLMVAGAPFVSLLFGPAYVIPVPLAVALGMVAGLRILHFWPAVLALTSGFTRDILYANLIRGSGLILAYFAAREGYGVLGVAGALVVIETISGFFVLMRIDVKNQTVGRLGLKTWLFFLVVYSAVGGWMLSGAAPSGWGPVLGVLLLACLGTGAGLLAVYADFRQKLFEVIRKILQRLRR